MKPLISVIIPAYNCEETIEEAMRSILEQTYPSLEILVVDDGSSDATKEIAERLAKDDSRIRVFSTPQEEGNRFDTALNRNINAGYAARNEGFSHVRGEYVTFQDADDVSLLNRIEIQYDLLMKYRATHVTVDWLLYDSTLVGKMFDIDRYMDVAPDIKVAPRDLFVLSQQAKGIVAKVSRSLNSAIPFSLKRKRVLNKLFFGSLDSYPGTGNSPLFRSEVIAKVQFRPLKDRVWPSFMGRGADRDFNFQVAETFRNSYVFHIPLYLWRTAGENDLFAETRVRDYIQ